MTEDDLRVLQVIASPEPGTIAWTRNNTDDWKTANRLKHRGYCKESGHSATGMYWGITPQGLAAIANAKGA